MSSGARAGPRQTDLQGHRRMLENQWHMLERRLREHDGHLSVHLR